MTLSKIKANALNAIGNTPLVALDRVSPFKGRLFAKMEYLLPGGSVKDRAAKRIILDALESGRLKPGQPVVEMTSGNMGAGLAVVCSVTGNPFYVTMSEGNSPARARMMEDLGAKVITVPQVDGTPGKVTGSDIRAATEAAINIAKEKNGFYVDQFNNDSGVTAHFEGTGPEIWDALAGRIGAFVAAVGSSGTFTGVSRFLKRQNKNIRCAAVEPEGSEILAGKTIVKPGHVIQGTGYGLVPPHFDHALADHFLAVNDDEATYYKKKLAQKEGLYAGFSAGANVCAAVKLLESGALPADTAVVTILCDSGLKY